MSFTEKIDVLDLLINIIREHEEKLDDLIERLEDVEKKLVPLVERLEKAVSRCPAAKEDLREKWL